MTETDYAEADKYEEIASTERKTFDLSKRLRGGTHLVKKVTVFTDEELGEEHQEAQKKLGVIGEGAFGLRTFAESMESMGFETEAAYLRARADEYVVDQEAYDAAEAEEERLRKELIASALTFKLQGVPEIAVKKANRDAKSDLNIKGSIPTDREEEYNNRSAVILLSRMIIGVKDHSDGAVNNSVSVDEAQDILDFLPPSEVAKVMNAAMELREKAHFSGGITDQVDF